MSTIGDMRTKASPNDPTQNRAMASAAPGTPGQQKRGLATQEEKFTVFIRRTKTGIDPYWRGVWMEDGKRHEKVLCKWEGEPPPPGKRGATGNDLFEASREKAKQQFAVYRDQDRTEADRITMTRKVLAHRYNFKVPRVRVADLFTRWKELDGDSTSDAQCKRIATVMFRFATFMSKHFPQVTDAGALDTEHFRTFLEGEEAKGMTPRTWNFTMGTLRRVIKRVAGYGLGYTMYLATLKKKKEDEETIHRRSFKNEELEAIYAAAQAVDPELYPVIVAAVCTALRRGDVCCLRWTDVDLRTNFVTVKTSKTGETVSIPIFPRLRVVLDQAAAKRKKSVPYVFNAIALEYLRHPDKLDRRLRKVLSAAGYVRTEAKAEGGKYDAPEDAEAAAILLEEGMVRGGWTQARKAKARKLLALHFEGKTGKAIAAETGFSESTVSEYLHDMEAAGRMALVSPPRRAEPAHAMLVEAADGKRRLKRGSVSAWHAFRTTFCTIALANGMPMETLRKITGHRTAEIVFANYDRRGQEETRTAVARVSMPSAFVGDKAPGALPSLAGDDVIEGECVEVSASPARSRNKALKGRSQSKIKAAKGFDAVVLPPELAKMLANASPEELAQVAKVFKKKGRK